MSAVSGNGASSDHNVAIYSILINGSQIDPTLAKSIREIKIQSYLRLPDTCTLIVGYEPGSPGATSRSTRTRSTSGRSSRSSSEPPMI